MIKRRRISIVRKQTGAALIVALVLLAAITVIGVSNMQSASVELKMVSSQAQRNDSFAIAESAMDIVRKRIEDDNPIVYSLEKDFWSDTCTAGRCFDSNCSFGQCFNGSYEQTNNKMDCKVYDDSASERLPIWEEAALWSDANRHKTILVDNIEVKYVLEFLCFGGEEYLNSMTTNVHLPASTHDPFGRVRLRITVRYEPSVGQPIIQHSLVLKDLD